MVEEGDRTPPPGIKPRIRTEGGAELSPQLTTALSPVRYNHPLELVVDKPFINSNQKAMANN